MTHRSVPLLPCLFPQQLYLFHPRHQWSSSEYNQLGKTNKLTIWSSQDGTFSPVFIILWGFSRLWYVVGRMEEKVFLAGFTGCCLVLSLSSRKSNVPYLISQRTDLSFRAWSWKISDISLYFVFIYSTSDGYMTWYFIYWTVCLLLFLSFIPI